MQQNELATVRTEPDRVGFGGMFVSSPRDVVRIGVDVATEVARIIREKKLSKSIQGREYVMVEGWSTAAAMLGLTPREVSVEDNGDGDFIAVVELVRVSDGMVVGRASALCGSDESTWAGRPRFARRSMAVTRAAGKACRLSLSWIIKLAGFEPTPAEEMVEEERPSPAPRRVENVSQPKPTAPKLSPNEEEIEALSAKIMSMLQQSDKQWDSRSMEDLHTSMGKWAVAKKKKNDVVFYRETLAALEEKARAKEAAEMDQRPD